MTHNVLADAIAAARERRLVVLVGAGISALPPSNVPRWSQLYQALLDAMCAATSKSLDLPEGTLTSDLILSQASLDNIGDALIGNCSPAAIFPVFAAIRGAPLNPANISIGRIAAAGGVKAVLTTNFDLLLETALARSGVDYGVWVPEQFQRAQDDGRLPVVKLHGTLVAPDSLIETADQKLRPMRPHINAVCAAALRNAYLLVVGYSGADRNVISLLSEHANAKHMLWVTPNGRRLDEAVAPLIQSGANVVEADTIDVLQEIADALGAAAAPTAADTSPLDPMKELAKASEAWANGPQMGRWVGAGIVLRVLPAMHPLVEAIEAKARERIATLKKGSAFPPEDFGLSGVLTALAMQHLWQGQYQAAEEYLQISNILTESVQRTFDQHGMQGPKALREYYANSGSTLLNIGVVKALSGNANEGARFNQRAMEQALKGNVGELFFSACANSFQYFGGILRINDSLWELPAARTAARRLGNLKQYLELTVMEAFFRVERCETEQALQLVNHVFAIEKGDIEVTIHKGAIASAHLVQSYVLLRRGEIEEAWRLFKAAIAPDASTIVLTQQSMAVTREFMCVFGVQSAEEVIDLALKEVAAPLKPSRGSAGVEPSTKYPLPYGQDLIGVRDSACAHPLEMSYLWKLAVAEFWDDDDLYYELREAQCAWLKTIGAHEALYRAATEMILRGQRKSLSQVSAWYAFAACGAIELGQFEEARRRTEENLRLFDPNHPGAGFAAQSALYLSIRAQWRAEAETAARAIVQLTNGAYGAFYRSIAADLSAWLVASADQYGRETAAAVYEILKQSAQRDDEALRPDHWYASLPIQTAPPDPDLGRLRSAYDKSDPVVTKKLHQLTIKLHEAATGREREGQLAAFREIIEITGTDDTYHQVEVWALLGYADWLIAKEGDVGTERQFQVIIERLMALRAYSAMGSVQSMLIWRDITAKTEEPPKGMPASYLTRNWLFWFDREPTTAIVRTQIEMIAAQWEGDEESTHKAAAKGWQLGVYYGANAVANQQSQYDSASEYEELEADSSSETPNPAAAQPLRDAGSLRAALDSAGDLDDAVATWSMVMKSMPDRSIERAGLGDAFANWCLRQGHYARAAEVFHWCREEFEALNEPRGVGLAIAGAARSLRRAGELEQARELLERALEGMEPDEDQWHDLRTALAAVWWDIGRISPTQGTALLKAEEIYRDISTASRNANERGRSRLGLAVVLGRMKRHDEALTQARLAEEDLAHSDPQLAAALHAARPAIEKGDWSSFHI